MKKELRKVIIFLNRVIPNFVFVLINIYYFCIGLIGYFYKFRFIFSNKISSSVKVIGWRNIKLGKNVVLCSRTWLNVNHRDKTNVKSIVIGDNTFIGEDNFFTSGLGIDLGPYVLTASHCSFIGSSHIIDNPLKPYLATGVEKKNFIRVGANCFFGFGASVIGNVKIGHGCVVGAKAVVFSNVPPFSIVVGNPAKVIKRFDFKINSWVSPAIFNEADVIAESEYIKLLEDQNELLLMPYILANSKFNNII